MGPLPCENLQGRAGQECVLRTRVLIESLALSPGHSGGAATQACVHSLPVSTLSAVTWYRGPESKTQWTSPITSTSVWPVSLFPQHGKSPGVQEKGLVLLVQFRGLKDLVTVLLVVPVVS